MERFLKRKAPSSSGDNEGGSFKGNATSKISQSRSGSTPINVTNMDDLPLDPVERPRILDYNVNQRDEIRRHYWLRGPCQPRGHDFPRTIIGNKPRRFISN